jgi:hypothetical protein
MSQMKKHGVKRLAAIAIALAGLLMASGVKANLVPDCASVTGSGGKSAPAAGRIASLCGMGLAQAGSLLCRQGAGNGGILGSSFNLIPGFSIMDDNGGNGICGGANASICSPSENSMQVRPVPGTSTMIAGVLFLLPFGVSMMRMLCRSKTLRQ